MVAAPIGPVSMLCIRYTLYQGLMSGLVVVMGASFGDMIYTSIVGFGLNGISEYLAILSKYIRSLGGGFLMYLGVKALLSDMIRRKNRNKINIDDNDNHSIDSKMFIFIISFITTAISPMTILLFFSMFTAIGIVGNNWIDGVVIVSGAFIGSVLWFSMLALVVLLLKRKLSDTILGYTNCISGAVLIIFGLCSTISAII